MKQSDATYYPLDTYICTLTTSSFMQHESGKNIIPFESSLIVPPTDGILTLTKQSCDYIKHIDSTIIIQEEESASEPNKTAKIWIKLGKAFVLTEKEKFIITGGKKLNDLHVTAVNIILKGMFPNLNGLQTSNCQYKRPLENPANAIQIIHIEGDHWAVISSLNCAVNKVNYYDSIDSDLPATAEEIILKLFPEDSAHNGIKVNVIACPKQNGATDCGLYAIAFCTSLCHNIDPVTILYVQDEMRLHLVESIEKKKLEPFPIKRKRRVTSPVQTSKLICLCPSCSKGEGEELTLWVQCEQCHKWFHDSCVPIYDRNEKWLCEMCLK